MNTLLFPLPRQRWNSRLLPGRPAVVISRRTVAPPRVGTAVRSRLLRRAPSVAAALAAVLVHAAPLALGLPLAAVPLAVAGLGLAAMLVSRWSLKA